MRAKKNVQLLKLPELKVHVWNEVSEGFYHNTLKQIVFLQNGTLKILDGDSVSLPKRWTIYNPHFVL